MSVTTLRKPKAVAPVGPTLSERTGQVAAVAAAHAVTVDRDGLFPEAALSAARGARVLGAQIPREFGGEGASVLAIADLCYTLGRACSSTAMIVAMHQIKVACLVRHGRGSAWHEDLMRRVAREQMLLASSTTEGQNGGNVRWSKAAVGHHGSTISLERAATVISYGAQADGIVTIARRSEDAAGSDQVLVALTREDYTLERTVAWETTGMRGTCSAGFTLRAEAGVEQVFAEPYGAIHAQTMTPVAHILWASVWAGIAAAALERAQGFTRKAARGAGGQMPPGAAHVTDAKRALDRIRALVASIGGQFEAAANDGAKLASLAFQSSVNLLKVEASELAVQSVMASLRACGLSGYRTDGDASVGRQLRDVLSAPLMINNERILSNIATATLMSGVPAGMRD